MMEQYIARELKEDIKYLIKRVTELNDKMDSKMKEHKEQFKRKEDIKLLDNFDWAAVGIAACSIVLFIHLIINYSRGI